MPTNPAASEAAASEAAAGATSQDAASRPAATNVHVTLLGTGTSTGVPVIGCGCRVCQSEDPRDVRMRCAGLVEAGGQTLLIDAGPDFRQQALRFGIDRLDAVLFTHHHFDHVVGLDDLRPFFFRNRAPLPCYAPPATAERLRTMFPYIFVHDHYKAAPKLELREIGTEPFVTHGRYPGARSRPVEVTPIRLFHGEMPIAGYRVGRFAYLTDTSRIPEESFAHLGGLDTLVLDALRREPHATHFSIDEAVDAARRIGARQTYFIHMTHNVPHAEEDARLPSGIHLGYDGLSFEVRGQEPNSE